VLSPAQQRLSDQMISYWTRFAHTGNPNGPATPAWPQFRPSGQHVQSLTTGSQGIRPAHMCDFWQV
jgi:para-nitrobenzyl esterase